MDWAVEKEITNGTGDGLFSPEETCTRGQIAAFLYRESFSYPPCPRKAGYICTQRSRLKGRVALPRHEETYGTLHLWRLWMRTGSSFSLYSRLAISISLSASRRGVAHRAARLPLSPHCNPFSAQ